VRQMKFQAVISGFYRSGSRFSIACDYFLNLFFCNGFDHISAKIHIRNNQHLRLRIHACGNRSLPKLNSCFPAVFMDCICQFFMSFNQVIFTDRYKMRRRTWRMYGGYFYNIQCASAFCSCSVVSNQFICHCPVFRRHSRSHSRQNNSVFQLHITNLNWSK